jgi:hypothetical protein
MALCVAYFIVLTVRRLHSTKMTIRSANCVSNYADSSSRHVLDVFGMFFPLIYVRRYDYVMHFMNS